MAWASDPFLLLNTKPAGARPDGNDPWMKQQGSGGQKGLRRPAGLAQKKRRAGIHPPAGSPYDSPGQWRKAQPSRHTLSRPHRPSSASFEWIGFSETTVGKGLSRAVPHGLL